MSRREPWWTFEVSGKSAVTNAIIRISIIILYYPLSSGKTLDDSAILVITCTLETLPMKGRARNMEPLGAFCVAGCICMSI